MCDLLLNTVRHKLTYRLEYGGKIMTRADKYGESKYLKKQDLKEFSVLDPALNVEKLEEVTAIVLDKFLVKVAHSADFDGRDVSAIERLANAVTKIADNKRKQEEHDTTFGQDLNKEQVLELMATQMQLLSESERLALFAMSDALKLER